MTTPAPTPTPPEAPREGGSGGSSPQVKKNFWKTRKGIATALGIGLGGVGGGVGLYDHYYPTSPIALDTPSAKQFHVIENLMNQNQSNWAQYNRVSYDQVARLMKEIPRMGGTLTEESKHTLTEAVTALKDLTDSKTIPTIPQVGDALSRADKALSSINDTILKDSMNALSKEAQNTIAYILKNPDDISRTGWLSQNGVVQEIQDLFGTTITFTQNGVDKKPISVNITEKNVQTALQDLQVYPALSPQQRQMVNSLFVEILKAQPTYPIEIRGHTISSELELIRYMTQTLKDAQSNLSTPVAIMKSVGGATVEVGKFLALWTLVLPLLAILGLIIGPLIRIQYRDSLTNKAVKLSPDGSERDRWGRKFTKPAEAMWKVVKGQKGVEKVQNWWNKDHKKEKAEFEEKQKETLIKAQEVEGDVQGLSTEANTLIRGMERRLRRYESLDTSQIDERKKVIGNKIQEIDDTLEKIKDDTFEDREIKLLNERINQLEGEILHKDSASQSSQENGELLGTNKDLETQEEKLKDSNNVNSTDPDFKRIHKRLEEIDHALNGTNERRFRDRLKFRKNLENEQKAKLDELKEKQKTIQDKINELKKKKTEIIDALTTKLGGLKDERSKYLKKKENDLETKKEKLEQEKRGLIATDKSGSDLTTELEDEAKQVFKAKIEESKTKISDAIIKLKGLKYPVNKEEELESIMESINEHAREAKQNMKELTSFSESFLPDTTPPTPPSTP